MKWGKGQGHNYSLNGEVQKTSLFPFKAKLLFLQYLVSNCRKEHRSVQIDQSAFKKCAQTEGKNLIALPANKRNDPHSFYNSSTRELMTCVSLTLLNPLAYSDQIFSIECLSLKKKKKCKCSSCLFSQGELAQLKWETQQAVKMTADVNSSREGQGPGLNRGAIKGRKKKRGGSSYHFSSMAQRPPRPWSLSQACIPGRRD